MLTMASEIEPPSPHGSASYDELSARLRDLRAWAGVSYRELHRRVVRSRKARGIAELPAYDTVHRCLQPGRTRLDVELVVDIARELLDSDARTAEWRQACQVIEGTAGAAAVVGVTDALPADVARFTGRRDLLDGLEQAVRAGAHRLAVSGMPGVGKSTFAVHAARRMVAAGSYGEIQLSVNLRGHDPDRPPADPAAVLDGFLRMLGVRGNDINRLDLDGRSALFRESLAGRKALVLLDNAAGEDQVLPLLPPSTCLTIITSRRALDLPDADQLPLEPFTSGECMDLLRTATSGALIDADPDSAARIAELCGRLPLAVAVVSGRIDASRGWTLADHVDRLVERRSRLRQDDTVVAALDSSYQQLASGQQRLLRLLALHPGRDLDGYAAAALLNSDLPGAERLLDELFTASMVQRRTAGRFDLHDLVRLFAADRLVEDEPAGARQAALTRLRDHYRYAALLAMDLYAPAGRERRPRPADPGTPAPGFADRDSAAGWLDAERANLVAIAADAGGNGSPQHTADLSILLFRYLDEGGYHQDALVLHGLASKVTGEVSRGRALGALATVCWRLGRYDEALVHFGDALAVHRASGNLTGEGAALTNLGVTCVQLGRFDDAIEHFERASAIHQAVGNRVAEADTYGNLGEAHAQLGDLEAALDDRGRQLGLAREIGHRSAEGVALDSLGTILQRLDRPYEALDHHERALAVSREIGYREGEIQALNGLGHDLYSLARYDEAIARHREALAIAEESGSRYEQACAHQGQAEGFAALGDRAAAIERLSLALALHTELRTPDADGVAARLAEIRSASPRHQPTASGAVRF
jgi:tetratricopeptide (TPR) repeat protein